jgi:hypothetical protein
MNEATVKITFEREKLIGTDFFLPISTEPNGTAVYQEVFAKRICSRLRSKHRHNGKLTDVLFNGLNIKMNKEMCLV